MRANELGGAGDQKGYGVCTLFFLPTLVYNTYDRDDYPSLPFTRAK